VDRLNSGTIEHAVKVALRGVSPRDLACTARVLRRMASGIMGEAVGNGSGGAVRARQASGRGVGAPLGSARARRGRTSARPGR
jgi:hypothetical protein